MPASTVLLGHRHGAAQLLSTKAAGRAPHPSPTSTSEYGFPKFMFRSTNGIANSGPSTLFNPFARSATKATPTASAAVANHNAAKTATSGLKFGSFYIFPKQYFPKQNPQYSAIINFNPKPEQLHRPQGCKCPSRDTKNNAMKSAVQFLQCTFYNRFPSGGKICSNQSLPMG